MSNRAIAKLFGMEDRTVGRVLSEIEVRQNADSAKCRTQESSTSAVPLASTEDRSDTREDARS